MATSDLMQTPQIIGITASSIKIAHPDISKNFRTALASPIAAAGTAMTVLDNGALTGDGFADNDWFLTGEIGNQKTEEDDVDGAVTRGTALTVTNALSFPHEINAPINKIFERGIKIYGTTTTVAAGVLIASIDAKTAAGRQLADAAMIEWHRPYTEYTFISTDTAYAYYFVKFTDGTTDSTASDLVLAAGLASDSVMYMINEALSLTSTQFDDQDITLPQCIKWTNEGQDAVTQFMYQDPRTGLYKHKDWDFELFESSSVTVSENENEFSLSTLSLKYPNDSSIVSVRLGKKGQLEKVTTQEMDDIYDGKARTELGAEAAIAAITLTVDSSVQLETSGTVYIEEDEITYTGKTGTTTLTGVPATGDGSITATHAIDSAVWQGLEPALPTKYAIFNGTLTTSTPIDADYDGYPLDIKGFKALTALTEASDTTDVTFTNIMQLYIAGKIEQRKGNIELAADYFNKFEKGTLNNAIGDQIPTKDVKNYYKFGNP